MRRYATPKASRGTAILPAIRQDVLLRDGYQCVGYGRLPGACEGGLEIDHVRASHGMGMKSETTAANLATLCNGHHLYKTTHGREARPLLLAYLAGVGA